MVKSRELPLAAHVSRLAKSYHLKLGAVFNHEICIYSKSTQQISVFCLDLLELSKVRQLLIGYISVFYNTGLYGRIWQVWVVIKSSQGPSVFRDATQKSYRRYKKFKTQNSPNQPKSQILFHKKNPSQDL